LLLWSTEGVTETETRVPAEGEIAWVHLSDRDGDELARVAKTFGCHPLEVEDMLHFGHRPKLEHYRQLAMPQSLLCLYWFDDELAAVPFCIVISERFVITVEQRAVKPLHSVLTAVQSKPEMMHHTGTLLYHLLDVCVDGNVEVADRLEERLDLFQARVFSHPERNMAPEIFHHKRRAQRLRRVAADSRTMIAQLTHETFPYTDTRHEVYFVDVFDHASRTVDALDSVRDGLTSLLDLQAALQSNRMNEVMKTLTMIATIFLPLSFIVGLYGMNFRDIPELGWQYGYLYVWVLMIAVSGGFIWYFKRRGWW
jgi:magnesium transporter